MTDWQFENQGRSKVGPDVVWSDPHESVCQSGDKVKIEILSKLFLVLAFLKEIVGYGHGFWLFVRVYFDTPEVTKIVLRKVLQFFE